MKIQYQHQDIPNSGAHSIINQVKFFLKYNIIGNFKIQCGPQNLLYLI